MWQGARSRKFQAWTWTPPVSSLERRKKSCFDSYILSPSLDPGAQNSSFEGLVGVHPGGRPLPRCPSPSFAALAGVIRGFRIWGGSSAGKVPARFLAFPTPGTHQRFSTAQQHKVKSDPASRWAACVVACCRSITCTVFAAGAKWLGDEILRLVLQNRATTQLSRTQHHTGCDKAIKMSAMLRGRSLGCQLRVGLLQSGTTASAGHGQKI